MIKRKSNIELLRIIAILMVILSHFNLFGDYGTFSSNTNIINFILRNIFSVGAISNGIFIIISGYFLINYYNNEKLYKKVIKLCLEMCLYSYLIAFIVGITGIKSISKIELIKIIFPFIFGNWFLIYYMILLLFVPFINVLIRKISKNELKKLIVIMFLLFSIIEIITHKSLGFSYHDIFILNYFIGAYIRLYIDINKIDIKKCLFLVAILILLLTISVISIIIIGLYINNFNIINKCAYLVTNNCSPFVIIIAISIFIIFLKINVSNKFINYISNSVLGIYLIHENSLLRNLIWQKIFTIKNAYNSSVINFIGTGLVKVLIVFITCLIIDKIVMALFGKILNCLSEKIYNFILRLKRGKHEKI